MQRLLYSITLLAFVFATACGDDPRPPRTTDPGNGAANGGQNQNQTTNQNQEECEPSEEEFCALNGFECGQHQFTDSCGNTLVASCGAASEVCGEFETCGGGGDEGMCGCTSETDEELCIEEEYECGPMTATDSCGVERNVQTCGLTSEVCESFETCGGAGVEGQCGCTPTTCEAEGILCGTISDQCDGELHCDLFCANQIDVGDQHGCAVGSGSIKCWGRNSFGQLGVGDTSNRQNPEDVIGVDAAVQVSAGSYHSCALMEDSSVRCWGNNSRGQLGVGSTVSTTEPSSQAIFSGAVSIASGEYHSCAIIGADVTFADPEGGDKVLPAGQVHCWGSNDFGQIGDPILDFGTTVGIPTLVDLPYSPNMVAVEIAVGANHSCALMGEIGGNAREAVYCWGLNTFGQINPREPNYDEDTVLAGVAATGGILSRVGTPTQISHEDEMLRPRSITAGENHTCVLDDDTEDVVCWGALYSEPRTQSPCNFSVTFIDSDGEPQETPTTLTPSYCSILPRFDPDDEETEFFPALNYSIQSNGRHQNSSAIINGLSNAPFRFSIRQTPGAANHLPPLSIASGSNHFCAVVDIDPLTHSNLFCLGNNRYGQIGDGTDNNWFYTRNVNRDVNDGIVEAVQVSMGLDFSCALLVNNNVQCWGNNQHGQIGNSELQEDESFRPFDVRLQVAD